MIDFKKIEAMIPVSDAIKKTVRLRTFSFAKWPLLFLTSPRVIELSDGHCRLLMPFRKIIKNHFGSVYFGALAMGADACVGLLAFEKIRASGESANFIFKSFQAEFLKRAEGDTIFICNQGDEIQDLLNEALASGERVHRGIKGVATVNDEEVLRFTLELSIKRSKS